MNASVDAASFHAKYLDKSARPADTHLDEDPLSAKYALLMGLLPEKSPVTTLAAKNCSNVQHCRIPQLCNINPIPDPNNVKLMTNFLPNISLNVGQTKTPSSIPRGYADESDPKDAPMGNEKCFPSAG